MDYFKQL